MYLPQMHRITAYHLICIILHVRVVVSPSSVFFVLKPRVSDSREKVTQSRISEQDTKLLHKTRLGMKYFRIMGCSGSVEYF